MVDKKLMNEILEKNPQIDPESFRKLVDLFTDENGELILKRKGYELDMDRRARFLEESDLPVKPSQSGPNRHLHDP